MNRNMNNITTGLIIGSIVGVSSIALMNMDGRDIRRVQRKGRQFMNKAEDLVDDLKGFR